MRGEGGGPEVEGLETGEFADDCRDLPEFVVSQVQHCQSSQTPQLICSSRGRGQWDTHNSTYTTLWEWGLGAINLPTTYLPTYLGRVYSTTYLPT